eukprot:5403279-Pleurochrysis_carterae.AAC.1
MKRVALGKIFSKPKASTERKKAFATAESGSIKTRKASNCNCSVQYDVMPSICMRKFKGMLVVCAQQETQRRQADFLYRPRAIWPCGNAMKPVGARPGEQKTYLEQRRSRVMRSSGSSFHLGVASFKVTRED